MPKQSPSQLLIKKVKNGKFCNVIFISKLLLFFFIFFFTSILRRWSQLLIYSSVSLSLTISSSIPHAFISSPQ